jgi:hypothetical protein
MHRRNRLFALHRNNRQSTISTINSNSQRRRRNAPALHGVGIYRGLDLLHVSDTQLLTARAQGSCADLLLCIECATSAPLAQHCSLNHLTVLSFL